jgi:two-component system, cell cycle response regulator DivK
MALVLVVEDHPMNRKLFRDILGFQFEVVEAGSAEEARERLRSLAPDLILMDVQLPGMDGLTFTRELKADARTAGVPVVAVSAHAMTRDLENARAAGCADYITKPITDDLFDFLARLSRYMKEDGGRRKEESSPAR